jgi:CRP-like cAMP-binding protein
METTGTWLTRVVEILQPVSMRADRLAATQTFGGLPRLELEMAAAELKETLVERGTRLTIQGRLGDRFWLIVEGQALVSADARPLRVAAAGDIVGLAGILDGSGSPETTIALSPIRAFEAGREQLNRLMARKPIKARLVAAAGMATRTGAARRRSSAAG